MFDELLLPTEFREATSDVAWLQALLDAEAALAAAAARAGLIPADAAEAVAAACRAEAFDPAAIGEAGRTAGNPVEPLVRALAEAVGDGAADYVHWGATSQDILDTGAMLVARRVLDLLLAQVDVAASRCAELASEHRATPMVGRTLLQHAVPTTFGARAAGWLVALVEVRTALARVRAERLAVQLGGAAGTLAAFGDRGEDVLRHYAEWLGLAEPAVPWHTDRTRVGELAAALALTAGVVEKVARDVILLAQTEVGEVAEGSAGGSSTMPHKQNPVRSTLAIACARQVLGGTVVLLGAMPQEHERAAGAWHAEWPALKSALAYAGGAVSALADILTGVRVDTERMRANLALLGDAVMAERLSFALADRLGRRDAHDLVRRASDVAQGSGTTLRDAILAEERNELTPAELDELLDPTTYLGSADRFVDRALALYAENVRR